MQHLAVGHGCLDAVADGVSEVEQRPDIACLVLVGFHHAGLDGDVACDQIGRNLAATGVQGREIVEHRRIANHRMFDRFGESLAKLAVRQRAECFRIDENQTRLMKDADEVFTFAHIHTGFAADRGIDLSNDGRRYLNKWNAPIKNGGNEARQVTNHTTT